MSNDEKVKNLAEKVLKSCNIPNDQKFGSVIAILMMISIILTIIRAIQECNKNKIRNLSFKERKNIYSTNINLFSKKRSIFTRFRLRRIIKNLLLTEDYNKYGIKMAEAILDNGENLTDDELSTLMEVANV